MFKKIINAMILFFSMLVPKSDNIHVFGAWFGNKFSDNTKYMYLYMLENSEKRCYWITKNIKVYEEMKKDGLPVLMHNSFKGVLYQLRAKYVYICTDISDVNSYLIGNAYIINFFHGVIYKKIGFDDIKSYSGNLRNKHRISLAIKRIAYRKKFFTITEKKYISIYQSAFRAKKWQLILSGQPRNDIFFRDFSIDNNTNIFDNKKVILYMPTHRMEGKKYIDINNILELDKINNICKNNNYLFVIKKHYYHKNETFNSFYSNIIDITNTELDTQYLLKYADILITDYSSCFIDYLLLNRPILFYNYDSETYKMNDREFYFKYEDIIAGDIVSNCNDLTNAIMNLVINKNDKNESLRKNILAFFYDVHSRNKACENMLMYIENKELEKRYKKRKYN